VNRHFNFKRTVIDWSSVEGCDVFICAAWAKGYSASQIAVLVNDKFEISATRNAIIGRLSRLGVTKGRTAGGGYTTANPAPKKPTSARTNPQEAARIIKRTASTRAATNIVHAQRIKDAPAVLKAIEDAPSVAPESHQHVAYPDLDEGMCAWPISGTGQTMVCCGGKAMIRKPYCAHHARVGASR
jgi:GcrA cell cycle regulator